MKGFYIGSRMVVLMEQRRHGKSFFLFFSYECFYGGLEKKNVCKNNMINNIQDSSNKQFRAHFHEWKRESIGRKIEKKERVHKLHFCILLLV